MSNVRTVLDLLDRAREGLVQACHSDTCAQRYGESHLAALRAATAVIAARSAPSSGSGPRSVWQVLPTVAPELSEWAAFYEESGRRRGAIEAGVLGINCREADDLVRQSECFLEVVRGLLHLPVAEPLRSELVAISVR